MKIYCGHSREFDFQTELYEPLKSSRIFIENEVILPHEKKQEPNYDIKKLLGDCDLFIAEVSFPATGLGIELGYADMLGLPIICIHRKDSRISGSLKTVCNHFIEYNNSADMIFKLAETVRIMDSGKLD